MATAYTADVRDGKMTSFRAFALRCARAFSPCIEMREESLNKAIPLAFTADTAYHDDEINKANVILAKQWSLEDAEKAADKEFQIALRYWETSGENNKLQKARYAAMIVQVKKWIPPTPDHEGLKKFMLDQLRQSQAFDYYEHHAERRPKKLSGKAWIQEKQTKAQADLAYHTKERDSEIERTKERNQWIADLRKSLANYT